MSGRRSRAELVTPAEPGTLVTPGDPGRLVTPVRPGPEIRRCTCGAAAPIRPEESMPVARIRDHFERRREDLIAMLLTIQRGLGYLPEDALLDVAQLTKLPVSTVYGVATFYEQFRLDPCGRHVVKVCRGTACHVRGGDRILRELRTAFRIEPGETTDDNLFTLETVACFGSCALAPVVVIDDTVMGRMTPYRTRAALERLDDVAAPVVSEDQALVT